MLWAIGLIGVFYLMTLVLGFGAAALVDTGAEQPGRARRRATPASPLLAQAVGGGRGHARRLVLLALIAAVAFATILAVVAGLTLASASSVAHDLYANVISKGKVTEKQELVVARIAAVGIGAVAIALAIPAQRLNIAFLVALAFAVAASANLPALLYNLFWKRFNTAGARVQHLRRPARRRGAGDLLAGRLGHADRRCSRTPTSPGSRCATRASCPSRSASSAAGSARCSARSTTRADVRRDRGALADRRGHGEGRRPLDPPLLLLSFSKIADRCK